MIAYTRGVKGSVDEGAITFLFNASPSVVIPEGGMGASEAPKMGAEAFASYILEQFRGRVVKSSRKPWDEAKEYYYQLIEALRYRDVNFVRMLSETAAYPSKLDFDELMGMWLSLLRRERKKTRRLITYKVAEYGAEEFLKLIAQNEDVQTDADLRRSLLRVAQAFVDKNISAFNLTSALLDMLISVVQIYEDKEKHINSFVDGLFMMERSRKDRLRELVKKYIVDELAAIEKKKEEEEEDFIYEEDEDPYSIPCDDYCEDDEEDDLEDYYDYDDDP